MKKNKKLQSSKGKSVEKKTEQYQKCSKGPKTDNIRKKQLLEANKEEDRTIKRLEKLLKLDKRKKRKKLPTGFMDDGLDYLLEVIDNKNGDRILSDDSLDLEEDLDTVQEKKQTVGTEKPSVLKRKLIDKEKELPEPKKKRTLTDLLREKEGYVSESESCGSSSENEQSDELDEESDGCCDIDDTNATESEENTKHIKDLNVEEKKPKVWEDIYGRLRDEEGNVIKNSEAVQKYVPPSLRKTAASDEKQEVILKIKKNLKGLLNRLSESNMQPICSQIEELYMKYSRNDVNETLFCIICDLVLTPILTAPRLILDQAMLIALLHANIGPEVGAFFLQHLVEKLDALFSNENYGEGKITNNYLTFLAHLYNFKVTHSTLMFDVFHKLIESFQSKDIELIQLFLKTIGFVLRKDDPLKLKEIIQAIQTKASTMNKEENDARVTFMLETLTAIRNNNIYKIPDYDPSIIEHSKKVLRNLVRKGCSLQELAVSYEDLLKAEERGRWWIVGSAWSERDDKVSSKENPNVSSTPKMVFSEKILQLAQKQHMNTDVRKSVFCIIMTAEDFMDAFQKLLKLNLKHQQEREIINVILHCALLEKNYNPYYVYLAEKFCSFARKFQMSLQFSSWDKFKMLNKMKPYQIKNFAKLLSHCFIRGSLPLSVLKVIHYSDMDKTMLRFFRLILLEILLHDSEDTCVQVFKRVSIGKNLKLFRETIRHFMSQFLLKNTQKYSEEVAEKLVKRIALADKALTAPKNPFML